MCNLGKPKKFKERRAGYMGNKGKYGLHKLHKFLVGKKYVENQKRKIGEK